MGASAIAETGSTSLRSEEWRPVLSHPAYQVSSLGRIRSVDRVRGGKNIRGVVISLAIDRYGYPRVTLHEGGKRTRCSVHRLVCAAFHGPPFEGAHAAHLNHDKLDNTPNNLAWATRAENDRQNEGRGLPIPPRTMGESHPCAKLTEASVREIRIRVRAGERTKDVAAFFGVAGSHVTDIMHGRRWAHVR